MKSPLSRLVAGAFALALIAGAGSPASAQVELGVFVAAAQGIAFDTELEDGQQGSVLMFTGLGAAVQSFDGPPPLSLDRISFGCIAVGDESGCGVLVGQGTLVLDPVLLLGVVNFCVDGSDGNRLCTNATMQGTGPYDLDPDLDIDLDAFGDVELFVGIEADAGRNAKHLKGALRGRVTSSNGEGGRVVPGSGPGEFFSGVCAEIGIGIPNIDGGFSCHFND